jgi:hypothetical protein
MDNVSAKERADLWKRRLSPPRRFRFNVGTMALSDMWRGGYSGIDQLKNRKQYVLYLVSRCMLTVAEKAMSQAYIRKSKMIKPWEWIFRQRNLSPMKK